MYIYIYMHIYIYIYMYVCVYIQLYDLLVVSCGTFRSGAVAPILTSDCRACSSHPRQVASGRFLSVPRTWKRRPAGRLISRRSRMVSVQKSTPTQVEAIKKWIAMDSCRGLWVQLRTFDACLLQPQAWNLLTNYAHFTNVLRLHICCRHLLFQNPHPDFISQSSYMYHALALAAQGTELQTSK